MGVDKGTDMNSLDEGKHFVHIHVAKSLKHNIKDIFVLFVTYDLHYLHGVGRWHVQRNFTKIIYKIKIRNWNKKIFYP